MRGKLTGALILDTALVVLLFGFHAHLQAQPQLEPIGRSTLMTDQFGDALPPQALARLGTIRWRHTGGVTLAHFLADSKSLLTAGNDQWFRVWELSSGRELRRFGKLGTWSGYFVVSADGQTAATATWEDRRVNIWDVATGRLRKLFYVGFHDYYGNDKVTSLALSPDGKAVAVADLAGRIKLWKIDQGEILRQFGADANGNMNSGMRLTFSPDGKLLTSTGFHSSENDRSWQARLWDVATGKQLFLEDYRRSDSYPIAPAFSRDSKQLVIAAKNKVIEVIDVGQHPSAKSIAAPETKVSSVQFTPDGKGILVAPYYSRTIHLLDVETGKELRRSGLIGGDYDYYFHQGDAGLHELALSPDGKLAAVTGTGNSPLLIELTTGKELIPPTGHNTEIAIVQYTADQKSILTVSENATLCSWDSFTGKPQNRVAHAASFWRWFALSPDGKVFAQHDWDNIRLGDPQTGKFARIIPNKMWASGMVFTPNCRGFAAVVRGNQGALYFFDVPNAKEVWHTALPEIHDKNNRDRSLGLVFSPDNKLVAVPGEEKCLSLFDIATGKRLRDVSFAELELEMPARAVFSPDGRSLLLEYGPNFLAVCEIASGRVRRTYGDRQSLTWQKIYGFRYDLRSIGFSPDGRLIAQGSWDGGINIWDVFGGSKLGQFTGHQDWVRALAFSRDGKRLTSVSTDTTGLIWEMNRFGLPSIAARNLSSAEIQLCWADLFRDDARKAALAMDTLAASPKQVLAFLRDILLKPSPALDLKQIQQWISELDHTQFALRERATGELANLGEEIVPELQKALENNPSPEARRRLVDLIERAGKHRVTGEKLRMVRTIELLDRFNCPQANEILAHLAKGPADSVITREALWSLQRWK